MKTRLATVALTALLAMGALPALAQDLRIGRSSEQSSIDPQFSRTGNNQMTANMIFGQLVEFDQNLQVSPGLAESWKNIDPLTWEITLRDGVTFHDGKVVTIDDVIFSMYVLCDPTYDGSATLYSQPILGLEEYREGMATLSSLIAAAGEDNTDFSL